MTTVNPEIYDAAHKTAVYTHRPLGVLNISGKTRLDLLHRMSTQKLNGLKSGQGAATILTTDIGRSIDRLLVYANDDTIQLLTGENNGDVIASYLRRFVFYNDDFHMQDVSAETAVLHIYGAQASHLLGVADLPLHHWQAVTLAGAMATLHRADPITGDGVMLLCETAVLPQITAHLHEIGIQPADEATFDYLRIESGLPRFGYEISQDYIPLETSLWDDISFNKGCYIGQEIIARMDSRGKVAKTVHRFTPPIAAHIGDKIMADGKKVGSITSAADGPAGAMAMGYVKTAVLEAKKPLTITS
jgi:aminomethyltransferase